ncbi:hypothetical protein HY045_02850 [Candidatus Woesebacteria bacterium]|nr:hypothetical protein [Candidatus Woesebacteria bacterium]
MKKQGTENESCGLDTKEILDDLHPQVLQIITKANEIFIKGYASCKKIMWKGESQLSTSVLTDTDLVLDHYLREQLAIAFPNVGCISEEQEKGPQAKRTWIIDPLDGSANFANKIPITGISIALWEKGKPIYGILSFPLENEIIHAAYKKGVFYNGKQISFPSFHLPPHLHSLFTGVGRDKDKLNVIRGMIKVVPLPNNYQSASFHFKALALRRAQCGVFMNLPIWDIAAGVLITKEAGLSSIYINKLSVNNSNLRNNRYTVVVGSRDITLRVSRQIKEFLPQ